MDGALKAAKPWLSSWNPEIAVDPSREQGRESAKRARTDFRSRHLCRWFAAYPREALPAFQAVCDGSIPAVEITLTVAGAISVIRTLQGHNPPDLLVGAGHGTRHRNRAAPL